MSECFHYDAAVATRSVHCCQVYIIHRRDEFRASKIMQKRTLANPKIEVIWSHVVVEAYGNEKHRLGGLKLQSTKDGSVRRCMLTSGFASGYECTQGSQTVLSGVQHCLRTYIWDSIDFNMFRKLLCAPQIRDLAVSGLFFGIGHEPATKFLAGQLALDEDGYAVRLHMQPSVTRSPSPSHNEFCMDTVHSR